MARQEPRLPSGQQQGCLSQTTIKHKITQWCISQAHGQKAEYSPKWAPLSCYQININFYLADILGGNHSTILIPLLGEPFALATTF